MRAVARINAFLDRAERSVVGTLTILCVAVFMYGMVARTLPSTTPSDWAEEVTAYLANWAILLSAASLASRSGHVATGLVKNLFPVAVREVLDVVAVLLTVLFCAMLFYLSLEVIDLALVMDERGPSSLRIPIVYYYLSLPVAMALVVFRYALVLIAWREHRAGEAGRGSHR